MAMNERVLTVESPDTKAAVDFLSDRFGVVVTLSVENGVLAIEVRASHGEGSSQWDSHDFQVALPAWA